MTPSLRLETISAIIALMPCAALAQTVPATTTSAEMATGQQQPAPATGADGQPSPTQDIVVTAQKREERLQDVPVPVTVISSAALIEGNKVQVKDFYTSVPGLSILPGNLGGSAGTTIAIRGITTGAGNPTVGTVIDDVPFGSSNYLGGGGPVPEFDPSDLAGIEVLRGPQGTLYGADSLGGLLKYVTVDPSTSGLSGRVEAGGSTVANGRTGYGVRGALNVPVADTLAVRVSGFSRRDPGYIDNVQTGQSDVNRTDAYGGRASILFRPSTDFSMKLDAMAQHDKIFGFPYVDSNLGDLQQSRLIGTGQSTSDIQAFSLTTRGKTGNVELTSITGYSHYKYGGYRDFTFAFGANTLASFGVKGDALANPSDTKKVSQELRLATPIGDRIDWLMGGFFTYEKSNLGTLLDAVNSTTGVHTASILNQPIHSTYSEYAAFANLTYRFTDKFNIQFGGRFSDIAQNYDTIYQGPYNTIFLKRPDPFTPPQQNTSNNVFTYLVTPQYKFSRDLMVYARIASGYRPGGPNSNNSTSQLPSYAPDKTRNYEAGVKGDLFGHALTVDASVFYIDWRDIQLTVIDPVTRAQLFVNGSRAKSQGIELSLTTHPLTGMTLAGWFAYDDAKLTRDLPAGLAGTAVGLAGDRLPDSSRYSGKASIAQDVPLSSAFTGFVGADVAYVDKRLANFQRAGVARPVYPQYTQFDLRAGIRSQNWTVNLYANNVTDKRGVLPSGTGDPIAVYLIQPRTIGLNVARSF